MDRREFVQRSVAAAAVAASADLNAQKSRRKPNILYVFSDQHRAVSVGNDDVNAIVSPTLDAFRRDNMEMSQCISNYPLCSPYRAILMSGLYSYQNGMTQNGMGLDPKFLGLGEQFRRNGYHTAYVGKWHLAKGGENRGIPPGERFGFEDWHMWGDTNAHYASFTFDENGNRIVPKGYSASLMTDQMVEFLGKQKNAEKPFFAVLSWNPPHPPFNPPEEDQKAYEPNSKLKLRPNVRFIPEFIKTKPPKYAAASEESLREAMQGYYGGVTAIDHEFSRVLQAVKDSGLEDDTIVIYTCDHGELMGSHGRMAKMCPYEESCHVPFYVRVPGGKKKAKSDALFAAVDIFPTLCGLAGIPVPAHCEGKDRSRTLRGESNEGASEVFLMADTGKGPEADLMDYRGVRTKTHTYAVFKDGRWCLYDNIKDPFQMKNLVEDPKYKPLMAELDKKLQAWITHTKDPFPLQEASAKVTGSYFK